MLLKLLYFLPILFFSSSGMAGSELSNHPSAYIRMHADDAVNWQIWSQSVLDRAKKENKLILISIGYYSCHWCHVMRKESFTNKEIGDFLNDHFISVKIDRELDPALDDYLMGFMKKTRGYGGWPLNVFITPDGNPLVGTTYKTEKEFIQFLKKLQNKWQTDAKQLNSLAQRSVKFLQKNNEQFITAVTADRLRIQLENQLRDSADELLGGLGDQAKFPRPPLMLVLLDLYERQQSEWMKEFIVNTLEQIMGGGLHDVISGGFFRYTVDPDWKVPHFEKMLYTNAGLIQVYIKAYRLFKNENYLQVAIETTEFMIRDLQLSQKAFVSAINSQDRRGEEGGAYVWDKKDLEKLLSKQQIKKVSQHWSYVNIQGTSAVLPVGLALGNDWLPIKQKLYQHKKHNRHELDDKLLPGWNGFALTALSKMVEISGREDFRQAGQNLYQWLLDEAEAGMIRPGSDGKRYLEDYAFVAQGLYDWSQIMEGKTDDAVINSLLDDSLKFFVSEKGWRLSDVQLLPGSNQQLNLADAQLPAADTVVLNMLYQMGRIDRLSIVLQLTKNAQRMDAAMMTTSVDFASQILFRLKFADLDKLDL